MSKLNVIRRHLASLRRSRHLVRLGTAYAAVVTALLWILAAVFAIDVALELPVPQRVLLLAVGAGVLIWAFVRFAVPWLGIRETAMQLALQVEKRHAINTDLVAALQFESPDAGAWGSRQLEEAVIDHVAELGTKLDMFHGFSRRQLGRRSLWLVATLLLAVVVVARFPDHAQTFWNRLLLGSRHYPSHTRIEHVLVNHHLALRPNHTAPITTRTPENHPVDLLVQCSGRLPPQGIAKLRSATGQIRSLELLRLTLPQREKRLQEAAERLRQLAAAGTADRAGLDGAELVALLRFDAPAAAKAADQAGADPAQLLAAAAQVDAAVKAWPGDAEDTALYAASLPRLVDSLTYELELGDAWTDPAQIEMIPLPQVELTLTPTPPSYVRAAKDFAPVTGARMLSVLEGSAVTVAIAATNGKPLTDAWLTVTSDPEPRRFPLERQDAAGLRWTLTAADTPFVPVTREVRFEIQVTDRDDLHLEPPLRSSLRLRADRPPTCSADVVHRVVLPTAKPRIGFRANDDHGIAQLRLLVVIERQRGDADASKEEVPAVTLATVPLPVLSDRLPLTGEYELDLGALRVMRDGQAKPAELAKGDRVKLTPEAVDFRGTLPGASYQADPLILEISDEAGVLAAISEADERTDKRLTDIIKQQLGIGESR